MKRLPQSENSGEPVEVLDKAEDLVQARWTNNMPGEEFPTVFSAYITVCVTESSMVATIHCPDVGYCLLGFS